ncbi:zinc-ribbon domain-containing protein [Clostridium saccharoperbutylacetonicum]
MRCSQCGQENEENAKYCDSCGNDLAKLEEKQVVSYSKNESTKTNNSANMWFSITSTLAGIIVIVGSLKMTQIKSVAGDSIAESFYNSFGIFGIGIGLFIVAIGVYIFNKDN